MDKYYARICWNSNGWVFPSGEAKELEIDSYVTDAGFGSEEWLFNFAWLINGYHYTFLQPVSKSFKSLTGTTVQILLYSINPNRNRVYVGELRHCEVLTAAQRIDALNFYEKAGWLNSMKAQVSAVGGDPNGVETDAIFNIRFRPEDVDFYQPPRLASPTDFITKLNRYRLVEADQHIIETQWRRRKGTKTAPTVRMITRSGQPGVSYDPVHADLQGKLFKLLEARFGKDNVDLEADFVDITITDGKRKLLVEIKSDPDPRVAIRHALGQILEYAYFNPDAKNDDAELIIIAPGPITDKVSEYVERLRVRFGIPVLYSTFSLNDKLPTLFTRAAHKSS